MCGVIGYVGHRLAQARLLSGLERLEYRGYDSAGICLLNGHGLEPLKAVGTLDNLKRKTDNHSSSAHLGIGHTRWATHGRVTEQNAHPLIAGDDDDVAIVLNGIVENYADIKRELIAEGREFRSETDAEVVAHLVDRHYAGCLTAAVQAAYGRLQGHFAFIAIHKHHPDVMVGARQQCPLVVGVGEGETFLASAITAFSEATDRIKLIEDGDIVVATADGVRVLTPSGTERIAQELMVTADPETAERDGHETFMLKEIHEQPDAVARTITENGDSASVLSQLRLAHVERVVVVACGTALHAGMIGGHAIEAWAKVPVDAEVASEWRYRDPLVGPNTLVVGVSQSGETADTLAALRLARARGAQTIAITNSEGSQITREVDAVLYTRAGLEIGVAATKTFVAQVVLTQLLALRLAALRGTLPADEVERLEAEMRALPHKIAIALAGQDGIEHIAERHFDQPFFFYLGRHVGLPTALEGALKLKEIAYVPTETYAAGEMKHGPIALLGEGTPVVAVATDSHVAEKLFSNLQEVRARGARVLAVATEGNVTIEDAADEVLYVPRTDPLLAPVLAVIPLQLLAYHIAKHRGLNVDKPRNLAKTVTVE